MLITQSTYLLQGYMCLHDFRILVKTWLFHWYFEIFVFLIFPTLSANNFATISRRAKWITPLESASKTTYICNFLACLLDFCILVKTWLFHVFKIFNIFDFEC